MSTGSNSSFALEQRVSLPFSVVAAFTGEPTDECLPTELIANARSILSVVNKAISSGYEIEDLEDVSETIRVAASLIETAQIFDHFEKKAEDPETKEEE